MLFCAVRGRCFGHSNCTQIDAHLSSQPADKASVGEQALPGKSLKGARGFDVEADIHNDHAAYAVRVSVDRKDRTYEKGLFRDLSGLGAQV